MSYAIITAPTPNPDALKFIMNVDVKTDGKVTFTAKEEAKPTTTYESAEYDELPEDIRAMIR